VVCDDENRIQSFQEKPSIEEAKSNLVLMRGRVRDIVMPGKESMPGIWTGINVDIDWDNVRLEGPIYIGGGSRIERDTEIVGPTWIGHGCHVESGAHIVRSILFEHTRIGSAGSLREAVVYGRYCVDKDGDRIEHEGTELDWVGDARGLGSLGYVFAASNQ